MIARLATNGSRRVATPTDMLRSLGPWSLSLAATLMLACVADPTSLGMPDSEDGSSSGPGNATMSGDDPGATGMMEGPGSGGQDSGGTDSGVPTSTTASGSSTSDASTDTGEPGDAAAVIFVNFDGVTLTSGADDAALDQAEVAGSFDGMPLLPYGDGPKRIEIMTALDDLWAPFDVAFTDTRPASGDYAMVVVTPTNPFGGGVLGVASQDCGDTNPRSVGMVFSSIDDGMAAGIIAVAVSHEAGRGFGLENVDAIDDIMNAYVMEGSSFVDACSPSAGQFYCAADHEAFCPPDQQNAFAELSARFPL